MTATLQATGLSTASNISAQFILAYQAKRPFTLDIIQLLRFIALSFMTSPPNYIWQQFLERTFPAYPAPPPSTSAPGGTDIELKMAAHGSTPSHLESGTAIPGVPAKFSLQNTFTKWFVDCITLGAVGNTVAFLVLMGIMKGQDWTQIKSNISTETVPIIVAGFKMWPVASIISFTFIPVHRRIVFLGFVGFIWGIYMSIVAARV